MPTPKPRDFGHLGIKRKRAPTRGALSVNFPFAYPGLTLNWALPGQLKIARFASALIIGND